MLEQICETQTHLLAQQSAYILDLLQQITRLKRENNLLRWSLYPETEPEDTSQEMAFATITSVTPLDSAEINRYTAAAN